MSVKNLKKVDIIKNITDFGAFIDLGGVDGLLHITDITWGRINHPTDKLALGENIKVKIIDYDKERKRISLGLKQLFKDPWGVKYNDLAVFKPFYDIWIDDKAVGVRRDTEGAISEFKENISHVIEML